MSKTSTAVGSSTLLFNPWYGFVWLVTYNGHWTFVRRLVQRIEVNEGHLFKRVAHAEFAGESYRIFAASQVSTDYVLGEFYWKVSVGMPAHVTDFVHPPRILSREAYPQLGEETWSQGEYVEAGVIQQAFNLEEPLPKPAGIYLNQPNPYAEKWKQLKWIVPLMVLLLLAVQLVSAGRAANEQVFNANYTYRTGITNPLAVTAPFDVKGGNQALKFAFYAPVDNSWLEVGIDLVNYETEQIVSSFEQEIEYYQGYDDGAWSEGSQTQHRVVPGVPAREVLPGY